jgi:hypothetical protein
VVEQLLCTLYAVRASSRPFSKYLDEDRDCAGFGLRAIEAVAKISASLLGGGGRAGHARPEIPQKGLHPPRVPAEIVRPDA